MPTHNQLLPVWIQARYVGPGEAGRAHCRMGQTDLHVRWDRVAWEMKGEYQNKRWRELKDIARELTRLAAKSGVSLESVLRIVLAEDDREV